VVGDEGAGSYDAEAMTAFGREERVQEGSQRRAQLKHCWEPRQARFASGVTCVLSRDALSTTSTRQQLRYSKHPKPSHKSSNKCTASCVLDCVSTDTSPSIRILRPDYIKIRISLPFPCNKLKGHKHVLCFSSARGLLGMCTAAFHY